MIGRSTGQSDHVRLKHCLVRMELEDHRDEEIELELDINGIATVVKKLTRSESVDLIMHRRS